MVKKLDEIASLAEQGRAQAEAIFDRIFAAAQSGAVFSQPVVSGNYTVITASEVTSGGGFGSGSGYGQNVSSKPAEPAAGDGESSSEGTEPAVGGGGGMGGGGGSMGRPIAVIVIGPDGVEVKPIVDRTKLTIAVVTSVMAAIAAYRNFRKQS
jgi:uncharacterized spore protein YtfJ